MTEPMPKHDDRSYAIKADRKREERRIREWERQIREIIEAHKARRVW